MPPKRKAPSRSSRAATRPSDGPEQLDTLDASAAQTDAGVAPMASTSSWIAEVISTPALDASSLGQFKLAFLPKLREALRSALPPREAVEQLWTELPDVPEAAATEARPVLIERALETLAVEQANADHATLERALDIVIAHEELKFCTDTAFFSAFEHVLEAQSVSRTAQTFTYLESRSSRVISGLRPDKGKGPLLLRACNELRRRLSKVEHLELYGRITLFLSASFPAGDRSSINAAGDFNLDNVTIFEPPPKLPTPSPSPEPDAIVEDEKPAESKPEVMDVDALPEEGEAEPTAKSDPSTKAAAPSKLATPPQDFYSLFWSLQRFFNNPLALYNLSPLPDLAFTPPDSVKGATPNLRAMRYGIEKTLETFAAATKKEKAVAGAEAKVKASGKAATSVDQVKNEYFFPKYLTSRSLLELQIADVQFRRQILVQILIVFQVLTGLTKLEKDNLGIAASRANKITLNSSIKDTMMTTIDDKKWLSELAMKCKVELKQTPPDGEGFSRTVSLILDREQNWIIWKLAQACQPFEKPRVERSVFDQAEAAKKRLQQSVQPFEHAVGTAALSTLWSVDISLDSFQKRPSPSLNDYHDKVKEADRSIAERKAELRKQGVVMPGQLANDELLQIYEARTSATWRGVRRALTDFPGDTSYMVGEPTLDNVSKKLEALKAKRIAKKSLATSATPSAGSPLPLTVEPSPSTPNPVELPVIAALKADAMEVDSPASDPLIASRSASPILPPDNEATEEPYEPPSAEESFEIPIPASLKRVREESMTDIAAVESGESSAPSPKRQRSEEVMEV